MGYNTDFKGLLKFKKQPSNSEIELLDIILGEDCRDNPNWGREDLTYIDLMIDRNQEGLEWDGTEKSYDMCEKINLVVELMRKDFPEFGLEGELLAQGEDIDHRYCIVYNDELDIFEQQDVEDVIDLLSDLRERLQYYDSIFTEFKFKLGDKVKKISGDYKYPGVIVSAFKNIKGDIRYVVESTSKDTKGMLHIFNENQLDLM